VYRKVIRHSVSPRRSTTIMSININRRQEPIRSESGGDRRYSTYKGKLHENHTPFTPHIDEIASSRSLSYREKKNEANLFDAIFQLLVTHIIEMGEPNCNRVGGLGNFIIFRHNSRTPTPTDLQRRESRARASARASQSA